MIKNNNVLVTFMYPLSLKYIEDFEHTVQVQSKTDFDIIIFNDNTNLKPFKLKQKVDIIPIDGSPVEIRFKALQYLKNSIYDKIYFTDSDDTMSINRIEVLESKLDKYKIVTNDLNLVDNNNYYIANNIWNKRIGSELKFDSNFIIDKNIVGFGNTAIKRDVLNYLPDICSDIIAADWFIFYLLLKRGNIKALFTSDCQTNYRQHAENIAGIELNSEKRIKRSIEVRRKHYQKLYKLGFKEIAYESNKTNSFEITNELNKNFNIDFIPFWWEL